MIRRTLETTVSSLGEDEVEVIVSTANIVAQDGLLLMPQGCNLDNYRRNPIWLWSHDPKVPVGKAETITVEAAQIRHRVRFAPLGVSPEADKIRGLVKSGIVCAASVGFDFDARDAEPIDPKKPQAGKRVTRWELFECSFVSVPADPDALVTARQSAMRSDMTEDASISEEEAVRKPRRARVNREHKAASKLRGMYGVGQLAYLMAALGYAKEDAEIEASFEGDDSKVPAMLKQNLADLGETLIAMTIEEVAELIGDDDDTDVTAGLADDEVIIVQQGKTPAIQRYRAGRFRARAAITASRAGKALSAANAERLHDVEGHHAKAMKHHAAAVECHTAIGEHHRAIEEAHGKAAEAHADLTTELGKGDGCDMEHCMRAAKVIGRNMDAISDENTGLGDEHEEMADCHRGVSRSIRAASRCLRSVDGFDPDADEEDGDSTDIQKSDGTEDDEGSRDADYRRRQADLLAVA